MALGSCTVSPSTGNGSNQGDSASDPQSSLSGPAQSADQPAQPMRQGDLPLVPAEFDTVPFQVWSGTTVNPQDVTVAGRNGPKVARPDQQYRVLGSTSETSADEVLAMTEGGRAFGTGTSPRSSRGTVGLIDTNGNFTALEEVEGVSEPVMLPGSPPFQSLNGTGASSFGQVVVWMSVGAGGKQWSLMGWNMQTGVVTELASSAAMTLDFSGISAHLVPGLEPPELNGSYAYFEVAIPQTVYEAARPGVRFHEIHVEDSETAAYGVAMFRVALDSPGDIVFVGPSALVVADPQKPRGMFWVEGPTSPSGDTAEPEEQVEGGRWHEDSGLESLDYQDLLEVATKEVPSPTREPSLIVWGEGEIVSPLLGFGPALQWTVSDVEVTPDYLVAALTKTEIVQGANAANASGPPAWLVAWDTATQAVVGIAKSEVAVPDLFVSDDLVVWGAAADLSAAADSAIGAVSPQGASDAFIWRIGSPDVYQIPSEDAVVGPQLSGSTIAVRQGRDDDTGWSFLKWLQD